MQGQGGRGGMIHTFLQLAEDSAQAAGEGVCFLFSKMKSVTYYTKCEKGKKGGQVDWDSSASKHHIDVCSRVDVS